MRLVFLGPPGSGKGTQAVMLAEKLGVPHISTGDLLRDYVKKDSPLAKQLRDIMGSGKLVDDDFLEKMLEERLKDPDCERGYILDGTPRDLHQAEMLERIADISAAILIEVSDEEVVKRLSNRWSCPVDHEVYNLLTRPPKTPGKCDNDGADLVQRSDDNPESIRARLAVYHGQTQPVIQFYASKAMLVTVNGEQPIDKVFQALLEQLNIN